MDDSNWKALCAYTSSVWGRPLNDGQRAAGWKLLARFPNEAVENAITSIAESGRDQLPPWSVVYKAAESIAAAMRDLEPQTALPAGDALSDDEHRGAMLTLRAKQTPEQRRRADRVTSETKGLPMRVRLLIAKEMLQVYAKVDSDSWDRLMDEALAREFQLHSPLVPAARADLA